MIINDNTIQLEELNTLKFSENLLQNNEIYCKKMLVPAGTTLVVRISKNTTHGIDNKQHSKSICRGTLIYLSSYNLDDLNLITFINMTCKYDWHLIVTTLLCKVAKSLTNN